MRLLKGKRAWAQAVAVVRVIGVATAVYVVARHVPRVVDAIWYALGDPTAFGELKDALHRVRSLSQALSGIRTLALAGAAGLVDPGIWAGLFSAVLFIACCLFVWLTHGPWGPRWVRRVMRSPERPNA